MEKCESCGAAILWVTTQAGKKMPVDASPVPNGNVLVDDASNARYLKKGDVPPENAMRYVSHFATCPNAAHHRKTT